MAIGINHTKYDYNNYNKFLSLQNQQFQNNVPKSDSISIDTIHFSSLTNSKALEAKKSLDEAKSKQGVIGKLWDGFKNITGIGDSSKKAEKAISDYESGKISEEEMKKAIDGYKEGQETVVDVVADMASGILAVGAFALAVPTGGASLAIGLGLATAVGVGTKIGVKAGDAFITGKEYTLKNLGYDALTGAVNGVLAPITNGIGNTVTKTIATKFGLKVVGNVAERSAAQGIKSIILNQVTEVTGGTVTKRALALGTGMAIDGALGGAADNMTRAAINGDNILQSGLEGALGGLVLAPVIGGGFRLVGKAGQSLNNKITMSNVLPDGIGTKFRQGEVGDCALLSVLDGMMNNPTVATKVKKAITKTIGGDYNVRIGDTVISVPRSAISDEILADKTGIRLFEQAYKQLTGSLDGGFAEVVAKQFGFNPVHIIKDSISDELLDKLAKNQSEAVLSLGVLVDKNGVITSSGGQRHYFTIKNINPEMKTVTLTSPIDTSKIFQLTYSQVKDLGISIDGGTTKAMDLPSSIRNANDVEFKAKKNKKTDKASSNVDVKAHSQKIKGEILNDVKKFGFDEASLEASLKKNGFSLDSLVVEVRLNNISTKEVADFIGAKLDAGVKEEVLFNSLVQSIFLKKEFKNSPLLDGFCLSLDEVDLFYSAISKGDEELFDTALNMLVDKNIYITAEIEANLICHIQKLIDNAVLKALSPDQIVDLCVINGRLKSVICPDILPSCSKDLPTGAMDFDNFVENLIKSNMLTSDIADIVTSNKIQLPETKSGKFKFGENNTSEIDFNVPDIISKLKSDGIDGLTTHEIHILTDIFKNMYCTKGNDAFKSLINTHVRANSSNFEKLYGYVDFLQSKANNILNKVNIEISEHAIMRMLDRNMVTVVKNEDLSLLNFNDFIQLIATELKSKKLNSGDHEVLIRTYNGSSGVKLLINVTQDKRIEIVSIM